MPAAWMGFGRHSRPYDYNCWIVSPVTALLSLVYHPRQPLDTTCPIGDDNVWNPLRGKCFGTFLAAGPHLGDVMSRAEIFEASVRYFLEPIAPLLEDDSVTEIMVNGHRVVYVERRGRLERTGVRFASEDSLLSAIHNVAQWVGREISEEHPVLDARLPDGSRVHAVIPPAARTGTYLTIRKFSRRP